MSLIKKIARGLCSGPNRLRMPPGVSFNEQSINRKRAGLFVHDPLKRFTRMRIPEVLIFRKDELQAKGVRVQGEGQDFLEISGKMYPLSVFITPTQVFLWEVQDDIRKLGPQHISFIKHISLPRPQVIVSCPPDYPIDWLPGLAEEMGMEMLQLPLFEAITTFNDMSEQDIDVCAFLKTFKLPLLRAGS